jgi:hypothetical protein
MRTWNAGTLRGELGPPTTRLELTVSEWVRRCLREARPRQPVRDADRKVQAIRAAARYELPTADVERMLAEIEGGSLGGPVGA